MEFSCIATLVFTQSMIESIEKQLKRHPVHDTRSTACLAQLNAFAQGVAPFYEITSIIVFHRTRSMLACSGEAIRLVVFGEYEIDEQSYIQA